MYTQRALCRREFLRHSSGMGTAAIIGTLSSQLFGREDSRRDKVDLAEVTVSDFSAVLGSQFQLENEPGRFVTVELAEANLLNSCARVKRRQPFSVIFRASRDISRKQNVYRLRHPQLGLMRLLLVPVVNRPGQSNRYKHYEAIFA